MNPPPAGFVPYESRFPPWIDALVNSLDYPWFVALLCWSLVLVVWWWHPRRASLAMSAWGWLPWSATAGVLLAAVEFFLLNGNAGAPSRFGVDLLLSSVAAGAVAGWCWQASRGRGRWWRLLGALGVLPLAAIVALRDTDLLVGGWWLAAATIVATLPWWRRAGASAWSRAALALAALIPLGANFGPLAILAHLYARFVPQNAGTLGAGVFQALAALVALLGLLRDARAALSPESRQKIFPEARPFLIGAAGWTLAALTVGEVNALQQLRAGWGFSLEQVHRVALQLAPGALAEVLGPKFQLDAGSAPPADDASLFRLAQSAHLATGVGEPLARTLADVTRATRGGLRAVSLVTIRDGWLVIAVSSPRVGQPGQVRLARRATPQELFNFEQHAEVIEGPVSFGNACLDFARLPLVARDGAMLGWLEFAMVRGSNAGWRARTAPFIGAVLGCIVAALFFVQHHRGREREVALRAAAVAEESARVKTEFLAQVSHELRTPLQNILGYGELMQADVASDPARARLAALRQNGEFMLRLVNDLLDLSAMEAGGFRFVEKPAPLAAVVRETIESLRPRAEAKGLALACAVAPDFPPWVSADSERFRQIVLNLAGNAVKYTETGRIDVALRVVEREADGMQLIEFSVRDTGPGIPLADQPRLFQAFARLDLTAKKEGTGLGLALTAALCRTNGGTLTLESDGRTGACFRARLRVRPTAAPAPDPRASDAFATLRGRRVLVADDNPLVRDLFAAWLTELGAICELADHGEQALALALRHNFDAAILDLAMPRLDGLAVARRLRALGHTWRIVGVSAHASGHDRAQALAAGMDAFLTKPVDLTTLAAALITTSAPTLPVEKRERIRAQLAERFRAEVAGNAADVRAALARRDWLALHRRAHYLKSSAGVVGDERLYHACSALEDAAETNNPAAADAAWKTCEAALAGWLPRAG